MAQLINLLCIKIIFLFVFVIANVFGFDCFGIPSTSPVSCSGNGICSSQDHCICKKGYSGFKCDLSGFDKTLFLDHFNIEANRLLCGGKGGNNLCSSNTQDVPSLFPKPNLGILEGKTIKDICMNKYWGIAIDSKYEVYVWGDPTSLDALTIIDPTKVMFGTEVGKAKKVACTQSSIFVLFHNQDLYGAGKNENMELGAVRTSFTKINSGVKNVVTNKENIFIVLQAFDSQSKVQILMKGRKFDDSSNLPSTGRVFNVLEIPKDQYPRIIPIDKGCLLSFENNKHFFAGKNHFTTHNLELQPKLVNFGYFDHISNDEPIDLLGRADDSCILLVSENKFYIAGENCPNYSLFTPSKYFYEVSSHQKSEYSQLEDPEIVDLQCSNRVCYILTTESLFAYGEGLPFLPNTSSSSSQQKLKKIRDDILYIIPAVGTENVLAFQKPKGQEGKAIKTIKNLNINEYAPSFISPQSMISGNQFSLSLEKPEVMGQLEPIISIGTLHPNCTYSSEPLTTSAVPTSNINENWYFYNKNYTDFYVYHRPWDLHFLDSCNWKKKETQDYYIYQNEIKFSEFFWLNYQKSQVLERREDFGMGVELQYKKRINLCACLNITKPVSYLDVFVTKKFFDRDNLRIELHIQIKLDFPLITKNVQLGTISNIQNFVNSPPPSITEAVSKRTCDSSNCYQYFDLVYVVKQGVCDPSSIFQVLGDVTCLDTQKAHPNCQSVIGGLDSKLTVLVDDICSILTKATILDGSIKAYNDWKYSTEDYSYYLDERVYFLSFVNSPNATISDSQIDQIYFNDKLLYMKSANTDDGNICGLVIDDSRVKPPMNRNGFHFILKQDILGLQFGESRAFNLSVKLTVTYLGNNKRRTVENQWIVMDANTPNSPILGLSPKTSTNFYTRISVVHKGVENLVLGLSIAFLSCILVGLFACLIGILLISFIASVVLRKNNQIKIKKEKPLPKKNVKK